MSLGPDEMMNIAGQAQHATAQASLAELLEERLLATSDPRALGQPATWESNPHYGRVTLEDRR